MKRSLGSTVLLLLLAGILAEVLSWPFEAMGERGELIDSLCNVAATALGLLAILAVVEHVSGSRRVAWTFRSAAGLYVVDALLRVCRWVPVFDGMMVIGRGGAYQEPVRNLLRLGGATCLVGGFCFILLEVHRARQRLQEASGALEKEIAERRAAQERLEEAVKEKQVLLREIHHRVKSNMQVISSLLDLQMNRTRDIQARSVLAMSQNRIRAMALIHEKLYQLHDVAHVGAGEYVRSLTEYLATAYEGRARGINVQVDADDVLLDVDAAIHCGLIVNELVTNALIHAFPPGAEKTSDGKDRRVFVSLMRGAEGGHVLRVADNGVGCAGSKRLESGVSLGVRLVAELTDALKGKMNMMGERGTVVEITFGEGAEGDGEG